MRILENKTVKEKAYFEELENGLKVIIIPKENTNKKMAIIGTKFGSIDNHFINPKTNEEEVIPDGVAHFLEHLFFKGTKSHPTGDMDRILESKGAVVNAATSKDFTHYYITIPSEYFDTAMELHSDMLLHPQIPRKELEKDIPAVMEILHKGSIKAKEVAAGTLSEVKHAMKIDYFD